MKKIFTSFAGLAVLAMATPALAGSDYLLQIPPEKGELASAPVEVSSWSFGACNSSCSSAGSAHRVMSPRDAASGQASGKRQHKPVTMHISATVGDLDGDGRADFSFVDTQSEVSSFSLSFDKSSPMLARVCAGTHIAQATLSRSMESFDLTDATVSCDKSGGGGKNPDLMATCDRAAGACASPALTDGLIIVRFTGGQLKNNKTGHVTLMK